MKLNLLLLSSVIATGCGGPSEEEFAEDAAKVVCEKMFECMDQKALDFMGWDDEEACREDMQGDYEPGESDCEYDADAANDCLDALEDSSCEDLKSGSSLPECDDVCPES